MFRALVGVLICSAFAFSDDRDRLKVGAQPDGRIVVPTNQILSPAGQQVSFPGRPVDLILVDRTLVAKNMKSLVFIDPSTGRILQTLASPVAFSAVGLLARGDKVYVTDSDEHVRVAVKKGDAFEWGTPIALKKPAKGLTYPTGMTWFNDSELAVACNRNNSIQHIDISTGKVLGEIPVGVAPFAIVAAKGKYFVTNWGGDMPKDGDPRAQSSGTDVRIDPRTSVANHGSVSVISKVASGWKATKSLEVGLHPSGIVVSPDGKSVFVANAGSDTVSIIDVDQEKVVETIACRPESRLPYGSGTNALAVSADGSTLYAANGTNNCIAVIRLANGQSPNSRILGFIPTGWYPGGIVLAGDRLCVANIKGHGSLSYQKPGEKEQRPVEKGRNSHDHLGTVSLIPMPDEVKLAGYTKTVNENNRLAYSLAGLEQPRADAKPIVIPDRHGEPSVIEHVIYVIKENRTYDQVFGDMKEGNGDPSLVLFGEDVTPNHHAIARQFTLFDNFYCSGVLSADGHQWCNEAYVTDYLERAFGKFVRSYPYEGSDPLASAPSGFLWDNALARKKTFSNYGEYVKSKYNRTGVTWADMYAEYKKKKKTIRLEVTPNIESLKPYTRAGYPGFVLTTPDVYRAAIFLKDLKDFETKGTLPNLVYVFLPCDHTSGTRPGSPTPAAMVADNDLALGQIVEAVSKSKFWPKTAIFVVEDDPQNGFDHVDSHRTVALVVSPYTKRKHVDSSCYNQTGMVKTMELILGLPPMNQLDLNATPMVNCFQATPDLTPYTCVPNRIPLDQMNPPLKDLKGKALEMAQRSMKLDLSEADLEEEDNFNRILWHAVHGDKPYPEWFVSPLKD